MVLLVYIRTCSQSFFFGFFCKTLDYFTHLKATSAAPATVLELTV